MAYRRKFRRRGTAGRRIRRRGGVRRGRRYSRRVRRTRNAGPRPGKIGYRM